MGNVSRYESARSRVPDHRSQQHAPPNSLLPCNDWFFFFLFDGSRARGESVLVGTLATAIIGFAFDVGVWALK